MATAMLLAKIYKAVRSRIFAWPFSLPTRNTKWEDRMSYFEASNLKIPRKICSCAVCGTKEILIVRTRLYIGPPEYAIEHKGYCKKVYHFTDCHAKVNAAVEAWNAMNEEWLDGFDLVWFEVDRVYETRWDCMAVPERVRAA